MYSCGRIDGWVSYVYGVFVTCFSCQGCALATHTCISSGCVYHVISPGHVYFFSWPAAVAGVGPACTTLRQRKLKRRRCSCYITAASSGLEGQSEKQDARGGRGKQAVVYDVDFESCRPRRWALCSLFSNHERPLFNEHTVSNCCRCHHSYSSGTHRRRHHQHHQHHQHQHHHHHQQHLS